LPEKNEFTAFFDNRVNIR